MKVLTISAAATLLFVCMTISAAAGELKSPSPSAGNLPGGMLADMGLAGLQRISDERGQVIRGKGFTFAFSKSWAVGGTSDFQFTFMSGQVVSTSSSGPGAWSFGSASAFAK